MNIFIRGEDKRFEELREKLNPEKFEIIRFEDAEDELEELQSADIIFDVNFDDDASNLPVYATFKDTPIFVSSVKTALAEATYVFEGKLKCKLFGMNALPTFINRSRWEISLFYKFQSQDVATIMAALGIDYDLVEDRVGMITPRILFMIINEACYTLQEGTASIEDIDIAMKLGTNYPMGPFEWCDKIGVTEVFETLVSLYEDTKDERYKICPLLKSKYLKNQTFYKQK
jgi:3-hydroxybutyryl-CoA dehydrogenase